VDQFQVLLHHQWYSTGVHAQAWGNPIQNQGIAVHYFCYVSTPVHIPR
jgi:hypothetical protein